MISHPQKCNSVLCVADTKMVLSKFRSKVVFAKHLKARSSSQLDKSVEKISPKVRTPKCLVKDEFKSLSLNCEN